jgi:mono/diheme cytochrome c family protein
MIPFTKPLALIAAMSMASLAFVLFAPGCKTRAENGAGDPRTALADPAGSKWEVPPSADSLKNPVPSDAQSIAEGKKIYERNCLACHGAGGKGDGPAAAFLPTKPGDLGSPDMWQYSDGNLFYKVTQGRGSMKGFASKLSDTQRWQAVDYTRTLAPKPAGK